jgi:hypothetical protein
LAVAFLAAAFLAVDFAAAFLAVDVAAAFLATAFVAAFFAAAFFAVDFFAGWAAAMTPVIPDLPALAASYRLDYLDLP